ncbi:MAG: protoporphyrinogen oxidase HemJ [Alphaproteobacteria bacterium]|nr:protoporphyrinogen oxidase HemJ [Alphaproteobacteria bacterium]
MADFLNNNYDWIRALHVIAFISWMAGLLYLPRLFVYHANAEKGSELSETLKVMERKLYRIIMNPAMIATWVFGLLMLFARWDLIMMSHWMHAKLLLVLLMTGAHHVMLKHLKRFAKDENQKSDKFFRILNELPTVLMILIVILAVVEPF